MLDLSLKKFQEIVDYQNQDYRQE